MAGTILKRGKSTRLQYMYNGERYGKTIKTTDDKKIQLELAKFIVEVEKGSVYNTVYTLNEYAEIWLKDVIKPNCTHVTLQKYLSYYNNKISPVLGDYNLKDINLHLIRTFINDLKTDTTNFKHIDNKPLANGTIKKVYNILRALLQNAFENELIESNPCKKFKLQLDNEITNKRENVHYYDEKTYNKVLKLLEACDIEHRALYETALKTGLRRSELFGLSWNDLDFTNKTLEVNKTRQYKKGTGMIICSTKTKTSNRVISIPQSLIDTLNHLDKTTKYLFENLNIDTDTCYWFKKFQKDNNIPQIRFHDLRHTHAVYLLRKGIDLKTISSRLGHASIKITADVYLHFLKELDKKVSDLLE